MILSAFRTAFPELRTAPDDMVKAWLALAANQVDASVFGADYDLAHGLRTAHLLAMSPYGKNARLSSNEGKSTYKTMFDEIRHMRTAGLGRVI